MFSPASINGDCLEKGFLYPPTIHRTMKYRCPLCGYVYDEEARGVKFEDLPDDWVCPVCGEPKESFEPMDE